MATRGHCLLFRQLIAANLSLRMTGLNQDFHIELNLQIMKYTARNGHGAADNKLTEELELMLTVSLTTALQKKRRSVIFVQSWWNCLKRHRG